MEANLKKEKTYRQQSISTSGYEVFIEDFND